MPCKLRALVWFDLWHPVCSPQEPPGVSPKHCREWLQNKNRLKYKVLAVIRDSEVQGLDWSSGSAHGQVPIPILRKSHGFLLLPPTPSMRNVPGIQPSRRNPSCSPFFILGGLSHWWTGSSVSFSQPNPVSIHFTPNSLMDCPKVTWIRDLSNPQPVCLETA